LLVIIIKYINDARSHERQKGYKKLPTTYVDTYMNQTLY